MALTKKQLNQLVDKINAEKERILNNIETDSDNITIKQGNGSDDVDHANAEYERAQLLRFRSRDLFYVKKLSKALEKIKDEEYGICEECDADIRFERLMARPTAELCISCKDEAEREESSSFLGRKSKSLGKKIDLVTSI